jgi:hypothetical protein
VIATVGRSVLHLLFPPAALLVVEGLRDRAQDRGGARPFFVDRLTLALMHKHFYEYMRKTSRELEALIRELRESAPAGPAMTEK